MEQTELYRQKLTTAAEAVKEVRSGDWVDYGWCTGTPEALDRALAAFARGQVRASTADNLLGYLRLAQRRETEEGNPR